MHRTMKRRPLGKTGIEVSEIAFGGVEIGMPYGLNAAGNAAMPQETESVRLLHTAVDKGINFFDTARLYGKSEEIMGKAFAGRRQDVVIATKCRHFRDSDGTLCPDSRLKQFIERSLQESLAALRTDYIDIYMLHEADAEILAHPLIADTLGGLKARGVIRATGASVYTPEETAQAVSSGNWDVIQLPFNLLNQSHAASFENARKRGIGIVVRSVLMKGLLSDRGHDLHPALHEVEAFIGRYRAYTGGTYPDLPALAARFVLSFGEVSSVLVGIDKMEYLDAALGIAQYPGPSDSLRDELAGLAYPDPDFLNLHRWSQMGWLK